MLEKTFSRNYKLANLLPYFLGFFLNQDVISFAEVSEYLFHYFSCTYLTSALDCGYKCQKVSIELHSHW